MYLLGHTDPTLTMRVYQQVLDMGGGAIETLERVLGCTIEEALASYSGREGLGTQWVPGAKNVPERGRNGATKTRKPALGAGFRRAADGIRTHDLLPGN
jgi:hypothetical protein